MQFRRSMVVFVAAVVPLALAAPAQAQETVTFSLDELNGSGASGSATLTVHDNGDLQVRISGTGFTPNEPHAQHIHGEVHSTDFFCPSPSADANGDGQVAVEEGLAQYGMFILSLTTSGDVSPDSGLALDRMPVADANGNIDYHRTIPAEMLPEGLAESLEHLHVVQHGLDVNGNGRYDLNALGQSVFAASLGVEGVPEEATNSATCGEVTPVGGVQTGGPGGVGQLPLMLVSALALLGAGGALALRRRFAALESS